MTQENNTRSENDAVIAEAEALIDRMPNVAPENKAMLKANTASTVNLVDTKQEFEDQYDQSINKKKEHENEI